MPRHASNASIGLKLGDWYKTMANLMVRNVDAAVVAALKARAGKRGSSAEAEHRRILAQALCKPKKKSFAQILSKIPPVGKDADFKRVED